MVPSTQELLEFLSNKKRIDEYLHQHDESQDAKSLEVYLQQLLSETGKKRAEIIRQTDLNATHAYQIFNGTRGASRDNLLQLAFAFSLDLQQTQRLLYYGKASSLYAKNKRDGIIIYALLHNKSLRETDELLYELEEQTISPNPSEDNK